MTRGSILDFDAADMDVLNSSADDQRLLPLRRRAISTRPALGYLLQCGRRRLLVRRPGIELPAPVGPLGTLLKQTRRHGLGSRHSASMLASLFLVRHRASSWAVQHTPQDHPHRTGKSAGERSRLKVDIKGIGRHPRATAIVQGRRVPTSASRCGSNGT
jgi:hypothetical protein